MHCTLCSQELVSSSNFFQVFTWILSLSQIVSHPNFLENSNIRVETTKQILGTHLFGQQKWLVRGEK